MAKKERIVFMFFDVNHPVSGEKFFGRESELKFFKVHVIDEIVKGNKVSLSLTGMNRIGKSSLVKEVCERLRKENCPDLYILETSLDGMQSFWHYWIWRIIKPLLKYIEEVQVAEKYQRDVENCKAFFEDLDNVKGLLEGDSTLDFCGKDYLQNLFEVFCRLEKRKVLIVIDEFDRARQVFGTVITNFDWFRGLIIGNLFSVITVSRRNLFYIETSCFGGSTFSGVFSKYSLFGFKNSEIKQYFDIIEKECGLLPENIKKDIWHYCGRSPYYLAVVGNELMKSENPQATNIKNISIKYHDSYQALIGLLEEEGLLTSMLQMFVGPKYNLQNKSVDKLANMGYCIKLINDDKDRTLPKDVAEDYCDYFNPQKICAYLAVCDDLIDYLAEINADKVENIWPKLSSTEKLLRRVIAKEFSELYGENWKDKLVNYADLQYHQSSMRSHEALYDKASPEMQEQVGSSRLNVMSFKNLSYIMTGMWDSNFKKYFNVSADTLKLQLDTLYDARNPICHNNGELMSATEINYVEEICDNLNRSINKYLAQ